MWRYIGKRLAQTLLVLLIISFFSFALLRMIPGDPVFAILGNDITEEQYEIARAQMGLDKPYYTQYFEWMGGILRGDFGYSYYFRMNVAEVVAVRLPVTVYLGIASTVLSILLGVMLGVVAAVRRNTWVDSVITVLANIGTATPVFWLGVIMILVFALTLGWLPVYGFSFPWETGLATSVRQSIMPLVCMSIGGIASFTRQTRSSMLEVVRQDYIRTARSKGLRQREVVWGHAVKNALIPVLTLIGFSIRNTVGGSAIVESVFSIPGMGSLMVQSINSRDIVTLQACILIVSVITCLANLLVDIAYACVDPRIQLQ